MRQDRPNKLWPKGCQVEFLDAYGHNPRHCKVLKHFNEFEILVEDERGVRHCGKTWRVASEPPPALDEFDDLLGESSSTPEADDLFGDLLG